MQKVIYPSKLQVGDVVEVIAPSRSLSIVSQANINLAVQRLQSLGLSVVFGKHVYEIDEFSSSSIQSRVLDLHEAFENASIKAIFTAIGGFNSN